MSECLCLETMFKVCLVHPYYGGGEKLAMAFTRMANQKMQIAALQAENANLTAERDRAREALIREWREKGCISHPLTVANEIAQAKYKREIAQEDAK